MRKIKRVLSIILALTVLLPVIGMTISTSAASDMTFTVVPVKAATQGSTVTVKVTLANSKAVCAVNPYVVFDSTKLEFVSGSNGDVFAKNAFSIGEAYDGRVRILYFNGLTNTSKNGTVCTLKFKVLPKAKGYATVKLDFPKNSIVDAKENAPAFKTVDGYVEIKSPVIYASSATADNAIDEAYYQKVPFFSAYKKQSVQLKAGIIGDKVKSVKWSSDSKRLVVSETGLVTPGRIWHCRANITAEITSTTGKVYKETIKVEFYKLNIQKKLPVI